MTAGLGFKSGIWDPGDYTKCCYSTCLISFSKHVEVIMEWLEGGTGRPEAALGNKSKWNMCHLESWAVPMGESRFLYETGCSAATAPLAAAAAQMQIVYTVLAVWDAVKSAGFHPYWTWASCMSFHMHHWQQFLFIYLGCGGCVPQKDCFIKRS